MRAWYLKAVIMWMSVVKSILLGLSSWNLSTNRNLASEGEENPEYGGVVVLLFGWFFLLFTVFYPKFNVSDHCRQVAWLGFELFVCFLSESLRAVPRPGRLLRNKPRTETCKQRRSRGPTAHPAEPGPASPRSPLWTGPGGHEQSRRCRGHFRPAKDCGLFLMPRFFFFSSTRGILRFSEESWAMGRWEQNSGIEKFAQCLENIA